MEIAGGETVVPAGERVSDEQVAAARAGSDRTGLGRNWCESGPAEKRMDVAGWQDVPAIRERRVHVISDELLNTPGPPLVRGAMELWKVLHAD